VNGKLNEREGSGHGLIQAEDWQLPGCTEVKPRETAGVIGVSAESFF
jgi:hypothetical protein